MAARACRSLSRLTGGPRLRASDSTDRAGPGPLHRGVAEVSALCGAGLRLKSVAHSLVANSRPRRCFAWANRSQRRHGSRARLGRGPAVRHHRSRGSLKDRRRGARDFRSRTHAVTCGSTPTRCAVARTSGRDSSRSSKATIGHRLGTNGRIDVRGVRARLRLRRRKPSH